VSTFLLNEASGILPAAVTRSGLCSGGVYRFNEGLPPKLADQSAAMLAHG
jgi:hypothetical protein